MKRFVLFALLIVSLIMMNPGGKAAEAGPKLPVIEGKTALAAVNGEPVALEDLRRQLDAIHEGLADNATAPRLNPMDLLNRMINVHLVVQEAHTIGLDELPEVKTAVEVYGKEALRAMLFGNHVRDIRRPDGKEADRRYREAVKEVKLASILLEKEEDAKRMEAEVKAGGAFEAIAKRMIDAGEARGSAEGEYMKLQALLPEVAAAVSAMKKGEVSSPLKIGKGHSLVKLQDIRFPEDPDAKAKAEWEALQAKRTAALKTYVDKLKKKYVTVNEKLLKELDYDSPEPGIDNLLKDPRSVAEVKGEKPVTVMELSEALRKKFYHGMDRAAQRGKVDKRKGQVLDEILVKRVTDGEARRLKIDRTPAHRNDVEDYRRGILFGMFVQKVIEPGIRVEEADLKAYLEEHIGEYTSPEMMRIESIAFSGREDAEKAAARLREGADFQWTRANAVGRVEPGKAKDLLAFGDGPIVVGDLPEGVRKAVTGAAGGEYRLCAGPPEEIHYVLHVREVFPPAPQPYDAVKDGIAKKVFEKKRLEALNDYMRKLRAAADVNMFAEGEALKEIVREHGR
jgi:parvulin-like peptidyl-prolyl isomerase